MSVTVNTDIKAKSATAEQLDKLMNRIASVIVGETRERVQVEGKNVAEQDMRTETPYTAQYARFKQGRSARSASRAFASEMRQLKAATGYAATGASRISARNATIASAKDRALKVNMTLTGRMMQALKAVKKQIKGDTASVEVGWTGEQQKKAAANQNRREFFGIGKREQAQIDAVVGAWVDEVLKENL